MYDSHVIPKKHTGALMKRRALEGEGHEGCQVEAPAASAAMVAPLRRELSPSQLGL